MPTPGNVKTVKPQVAATVATSVVVLLLAGFSVAAFFLGKSKATPETTTLTNTTKTADAIIAESKAKTLSGIVQSVGSKSLVLVSGSGESATTTSVNLSSSTVYRKFDYRSVPKNGFGDGTAITLGDVKVGSNIVVFVDAKSGDVPDATRINLLIFP